MSDTGTTVINMEREGQFDACQSRVGTCGYACCGFGTLGNFIAPLEGELELAKEQGLSFDHLHLEEMADGTTRVHCQRPCKGGEYKSIDCAIYPAWIANSRGDQFLVADNRKCPIPHNEMLETLRLAQQVAVDWELKHPGTIDGMAKAGADFRAYQPFGFRITAEGVVVELTQYQIRQITPKELLPDGYIAKFKGVSLDGYAGRGTPEDMPTPVGAVFPPLRGSVMQVLNDAYAEDRVEAHTVLSQIEQNLHRFEALVVSNHLWPQLYEKYSDVLETKSIRPVHHMLGLRGWFVGVPVYIPTEFVQWNQDVRAATCILKKA